MAQGGTHPSYLSEQYRDRVLVYPLDRGPHVLLGDHVGGLDGVPLGVVDEIHGESFGDGTGDTITVHPAAVTLSTGDRVPVADLVLLRRAES